MFSSHLDVILPPFLEASSPELIQTSYTREQLTNGSFQIASVPVFGGICLSADASLSLSSIFSAINVYCSGQRTTKSTECSSSSRFLIGRKSHGINCKQLAEPALVWWGPSSSQINHLYNLENSNWIARILCCRKGAHYAQRCRSHPATLNVTKSNLFNEQFPRLLYERISTANGKSSLQINHKV